MKDSIIGGRLSTYTPALGVMGAVMGCMEGVQGRLRREVLAYLMEMFTEQK